MASTEEVGEPSRRRFGAPSRPAPLATPMNRAVPSRRQAALFFGKSWCFRLERWLRDPARQGPDRLQRRPVDADAPLLALSRSPLYTSDATAEFALQAGKVEN